ncbi:22663_t:CDS:2 [Entrophospora sp. SA101]|nr:22663_t:CDS:2 [Entrophospora sp. SA101]
MSSRYDDFKDSQSYWENVCVKANQDEMIDDETLDKAQELTLAQSYDHYDIGHGELVYKGQISGYYMVDDIGVAVVPSLSSVNANPIPFDPISTDPPPPIFPTQEHTQPPFNIDTSSTSKPIETNKWYVNMMLDKGQNPIWPLPYGLRWENNQPGQTDGFFGTRRL